MENKSFEEAVLQNIENCFNLIQKKRFTESINFSDRQIDNFKNILKNRDLGNRNDEDYNISLVAAVFFQVMKDFSNLAINFKVGILLDEHEKLEKSWSLLIDCQERMVFVKSYYKGTNVIWLESRLNKLERAFNSIVNEGLYMSPVIIISKENCSICRKNIKACDHIPGSIYSGKICSSIAVNPQIRSIDIVKIPFDKRCRIWPWKIKEDYKIEACFMTFFRLDSFLYD